MKPDLFPTLEVWMLTALGLWPVSGDVEHEDEHTAATQEVQPPQITAREPFHAPAYSNSFSPDERLWELDSEFEVPNYPREELPATIIVPR